MNFNVTGFAFEGFAVVAILFGLVQLIFWAVVAWRAMRALEHTAAAVESLSRHIRHQERPQGEQEI